MKLDQLFSTFLTEKLITPNNGKAYGQIIFMAGGAGSGKGFAINNFIEGNKYKIRDVDAWKQAFLKINSLTGKYPELEGLDLGNPQDVFDLHMFVKEKGIKEKTLDLLFKDVEQSRLPNILFDITAKDPSDISDLLPYLEKVGYDNKNIHLIWVLTNYKVALERNLARTRKVPIDVFLQTHSGAALTMTGLLKGAYKYIGNDGIDGEVHVILNNADEVKYWQDKNGNFIETKPKEGGTRVKIVKDFSSLMLKSKGKKLTTNKELIDKMDQWVLDNVPPDVAKEIKSGNWAKEKVA